MLNISDSNKYQAIQKGDKQKIYRLFYFILQKKAMRLF